MLSPIFSQLTVWELTSLINLYSQDQARQVDDLYNYHASSSFHKADLDWRDLDPDGSLRARDEILDALQAELRQRRQV